MALVSGPRETVYFSVDLAMKKIRSDYLNTVLTAEGLNRVINEMTGHLTPHEGEFSAVAFRGMSGAVVAPGVAQRLNKDLIVVRKPHEINHSNMGVEGVECKAYVIIDDFIDSGTTIKEIRRAVRQEEIFGKLVGIGLYKRNYPDMLQEYANKLKVWILSNGTWIYPNDKKKSPQEPAATGGTATVRTRKNKDGTPTAQGRGQGPGNRG